MLADDAGRGARLRRPARRRRAARRAGRVPRARARASRPPTLVVTERLHAGAVADLPGAGARAARRGSRSRTRRSTTRGRRSARPGLEVVGRAGRRARASCSDALDADAVLVTPAHQFPTGAVLAPERRRALLAWGGIVIEDDYDSEYRYDRAPVGTLQRLAPDRVVYLGTASKTLAPALRLGWLLAPPALAERDRRSERWAVDSGGAAITARAYARLLATGEVDRHLRRTRREYRERRDRLVAALAQRLPDCRVDGVAAGLHLLLRLPPGTDEARGRGRARRAADPRSAASPATASTPRPDEPALVLGYGRLPLAAIDAAVDGAVRGAVMARVTLATVAEALGVSTMTVSNAYNRPEKLSAELRERVLAKADGARLRGPGRGRALAAAREDRRARRRARGGAGVRVRGPGDGRVLPRARRRRDPAPSRPRDRRRGRRRARARRCRRRLHPLRAARRASARRCGRRGAGCRSSCRAGRSSTAIRSWRSTSARRVRRPPITCARSGHQRLAVLSLPFAIADRARPAAARRRAARTASRAGGSRATA